MKEFDYSICKTQGSIYQYMADNNYDVEVFSNAYLQSDFCNDRMDSVYSRFHNEFPNECADFFIPEIGHKLEKCTTSNAVVQAYAWEIGFMYRKVYIETSIPSKELVKLIPCKELLKYASTMQHYGEDETLESIVKSYNLAKKRYDSEFEPMFDKETDKFLKEEYKTERENLFALGISEDIFPAYLKRFE